MAVSIQVNQPPNPPGVAGVAREDLSTGLDIQLVAVGGPFLAHSWSIISKPANIFTPVKSSSSLTTPLAASTLLTPVDVPGDYLVQLMVDSGSGLGATTADVARISFYAGPSLSTFPDRWPRRVPAFGETTEHNVPDALDPSGNPEGWAREWLRHFAVMQRLYERRDWASGRVTLTAMGATLVRGKNIAGVTRTALGKVRVDFAQSLPDANYAALGVARGSIGGHCTTNTELVASFVIERADLAGALVDGDFNFVVKLGD